MNNGELKNFYNSVYDKGEKSHYTKLLFKKKSLSLEKSFILKEIKSWKNKKVLDAGCGTGDLAALIAKKGAKETVGIDFSSSAVEEARQKHKNKKLRFECLDLEEAEEKFDVIVSAGALEHMDDPFQFMKKMKSLLNPGGSIIITVPNWVNPRGYILTALRLLFNAKITLADLHYFTPLQLQRWAKKLKMGLSWKTFDHDWAGGRRLIQDLEKRLPNVFKDSNLDVAPEQTASLLAWLKENGEKFPPDPKFGGAVGLYHFKM